MHTLQIASSGCWHCKCKPSMRSVTRFRQLVAGVAQVQRGARALCLSKTVEKPIGGSSHCLTTHTHRGRDSDPYLLLQGGWEAHSRVKSIEDQKLAAGLVWRMMGAISVAHKRKDTNFEVQRSLRFPGVFLVKLQRELAGRLGVEGLEPLSPEFAQAGLQDDLMPSMGESWVWTYRLHLNSWLGQPKQTLMLPSLQRWWFASEHEAAFARDYRLFRDCYDVHTSLGLLPPGTRPCLPSHRAGREQSPFTGVGAVPRSKQDHWRFRSTWGDTRITGSYTSRVPGTHESIRSGFQAAGLRERAFRDAFTSGIIAEHRKGGGNTPHKVAKPPYCNFRATLRLPGETDSEHEAWLGKLQQGGWGQPKDDARASNEVAGTEAGWDEWSRDVAADLQTEAGASLTAQDRLDKVWESHEELQHPAERWRGKIPGEVEAVELAARRENMVRIMLAERA